jgi:predicted RND superfamily exporter protein
LTVFVLFTALMAIFAARTRVDASFNKQLPLQHPYIEVFTKYQDQFGGANRVLIALTVREGDIFTPAFFETLKGATDEVFFIPGVDRSQVQSLFTPNVRYIEVVEDGFAGGNVIPADFQPTPEGFAKVREATIKSGKVGELVANDFSGAVIRAQLLEVDPATGKRVNYLRVADDLEKRIRQKFSSETIDVHIIGFAKVIGDIASGARNVLFFFLVSFVITGALVYLYTNSLKLTLLPLLCSATAVIWQMGILNVLGYGIDPLSILVPFLIFAIAVSHSVQMVRAFRAETFGGVDSVQAARSAFRQLLFAGGVALLTDTFGFITMLVIKIQTIQELAIAASLGVAMIIVTNLFLLPILLSYLTLPPSFQARVARRKAITDAWWKKVCVVMEPGPSIAILVVSAALGIFGFVQSANVPVGDLQAGVPELRPSSRYNRDTQVITQKFSIGVDILSVLVEAGPNGCVDYEVVAAMDELEGRLRALPCVQNVISLTSIAKMVNSGWNEGSLKWRILPRNTQALAQSISPIETSSGLINVDGSVMPMMVFLTDHKAETLRQVTTTVKNFRSAHATSRAKFLLASGNAGVMAATNEVVEAAQFPILAWVYLAVIVLCLLTFRSLRATVCIVLPLVLVSYLSYVVMVFLDIGLKTSTLPVVALGVGIGVDYGIYLFAKLRESLERGDFFEDAMYAAFTQTGSAVVFTGLTLAIGVGTWIFSDLKFQADMGVLLTFMFLVNMLGAIIVLPAMARWLFRHHSRTAG